jgi:hypothetical protein
MPKTLRTQIEISASKEKVWGILADFPAYPLWNPFIKSIEGEARTGTKLDVRMQPPGARRITLHPRVLSAVPGRELTWLGHLLVPGIFDGEHRFLIHERDGNTVTFVQEELFKGALVSITGRMLERTRVGFENMNQALKKRAEDT